MENDVEKDEGLERGKGSVDSNVGDLVLRAWQRVLEANTRVGSTVGLEPGATEIQLTHRENEMGYPIPPQYRHLLSLSNGGYVGGGYHGFYSEDRIGSSNHWAPGERFYRMMRMVKFGDDGIHVDGGDRVFQWDSSFDGQWGNTIVADSVVQYLEKWADQVETTGVPQTGLIRTYGASSEEVNIDESIEHRSFFLKFKREYERCWGSWPQFMS